MLVVAQEDLYRLPDYEFEESMDGSCYTYESIVIGQDGIINISSYDDTFPLPDIIYFLIKDGVVDVC